MAYGTRCTCTCTCTYICDGYGLLEFVSCRHLRNGMQHANHVSGRSVLMVWLNHGYIRASRLVHRLRYWRDQGECSAPICRCASATEEPHRPLLCTKRKRGVGANQGV